MAKKIFIPTDNGIVEAALHQEDSTFIVVKIKDGEETVEATLPKGMPFDGHFPPFFEDCAPVLWTHEKRHLTIRSSLDYTNPDDNKDLGKSLIPEEEPYVFLPHAIPVIEGIINGDAQFLVGPKGVGKTSLILQIAARIKQPTMRVNITAQMLADELFGCMDVVQGDTVWIDGPVTRAMRHGYWLLLDEFDFLNPEVSSYFFPVLEPKPSLFLKNKPGGEKVPVHPNFRVFASGNCMGREDAKYHGTQPINAAILDRFSAGQITRIKPMKANDERDVIRRHAPHLPDSLIKRAVRAAEKIRDNGRGPYPYLSTRQVIAWVNKMLLTGRTLEAAKRTWLELLEGGRNQAGSPRELAKSIIQKYGGTYVRPIIGKGLKKQAADADGNEDTPVQIVPAQVKGEIPHVDCKGAAAGDIEDVGIIKMVYEARMKQFNGKQLSHKKLEDLFNLNRANGMTAYRICEKYEEMLKKV